MDRTSKLKVLKSIFEAQIEWEWRLEFLYPFLQISPTYRQAYHLERNEHSQVIKSPNDIETVCDVYSDFGDVWNRSVEDWWLNKAKYNFDPLPSIKPILIEEIPAQSITSYDQMDEQHIRAINNSMNLMVAFWNNEYANQFFPDCAIIGVPLHGDKEEIKQNLCGMVDRSFAKARHSWKKSKYGFQTRSRIRKLTLEKCLFAVKYKAKNLDAQLVEVGNAITKKYEHPKPRFDGLKQDRRGLEIQTSEMLNKALRISEWAARVRFPCSEKLNQTIISNSGPLELYKPRFDYQFIGSQISAGNISEPYSEKHSGHQSVLGA